jgi:hypothetical protein
MINTTSTDKKVEKKSSIYGLDAEIVNLQNNMLKYRRFDSSSKLIEIRDSEQTNLFCVSVDGSDHSEKAYEMVTEEFLKPGSKILVMHVSSPDQDDKCSFKNKKETVTNTYATKVAKLAGRVNFVVEDKKENMGHALEQVMAFGMFFKANYLVTGYYGIKGAKGDNNELTKGVNYLLGYSTIPAMIIKDTEIRSKKTSNRHSWLFVFDRKLPNAVKCLQAFSQLIDPLNDLVHGLTVDTNSSTGTDEFKEQFFKEIEDKGIINYQYECVSTTKGASAIVCQKVNEGDIQYDFVVFTNNRQKHRTEGEKSDVVNIVKNCSSSVCFYNY